MLPYFEALGADLERAWSRRDRDEDAFSEVAQAALRARPPLDAPEPLALEALIDALLDPLRAVPRQLAPLGAFGQPGVTVFHGRGFVIDVYFWTHALSAVHDHPFRGAFTVLRGSSLEARYTFEETRALSHRMRLGCLRLDAIEEILPGRVEPFGGPVGKRVHALLHVPTPSVSMVVRTVRADGYLRYFPPGVALAMHPADESFERPLALLDTLRASGDPAYARRVEAYLAAADAEATFRLLSRLWLGIDDTERARWLEVARARHDDALLDAIEAALDEARVTHEADVLRAALRDEDDRFVATALVLADGRASIYGLLATRYADPLERLHRFVDESGGFTPEEGASASIAHALVDGVPAEAMLARLEAEYGEEACRGRETEALRYAARCAFARLARD
jgi:hypothetical protein